VYRAVDERMESGAFEIFRKSSTSKKTSYSAVEFISNLLENLEELQATP
jgi:hypothetical protein